jgi:hypothetical protein
LLLHLHGDIDPLTGVITNIAQAQPVKGLQLVLAQLEQASVISDVLRKGLVEAKKYDPASIRSRALSLKNIAKTTAAHILLRNFSQGCIANLNNEPYFIDLTAFFPQTDQYAMIKPHF